MEPEPIEELAGYAHKVWSGWMQYLFSKSEHLVNGAVIIPADLVERWVRQSSTPYEELPENEKESDREEALKMMEIVREHREQVG